MNDDKKAKKQVLDLEFDDISELDESTFDIGVDATNTAVLGVNATMAGLQTTALQDAINNYAQALNESAIAKSTGLPVQTPSAQYKGFAAEEYFKQTLKINALAKGIPDWQLGAYTKGSLPDGTTLSGIDMETDITVFTRKNPWSSPERAANYQSKIHNNAADYAKDIANAQYDNVDFVGGAGQGVNDTVTVDVGNKTVSSDSITPEEAERLADAMKEQNVPEYQHSAEKKAELNRVKLGQAVAMGAATGAILSTVKEIISVIKERDNLPEDQFVKSIQHILCGTVEGGIRGGAIAGSVQLLGKAVGKEIVENSIGAVPAMAIANTTVDFAKDLYRMFVMHTIDADDLLCNTVNNTFSSFAGFGGSWVGAQIAGSCLSVQTAAAAGASIGSVLGPLGTVIGSAIGGLVIGYGATLIIGTANKDAQKAFNQCIADINSQVELTGCDTMYCFADAMSELSEFKLSFKNLLPCYNLISDLKEYNLRKKAIKSVHAQLDASLENIEISKRRALESLAEQHSARLAKLESCFEAQRQALYEQFKDSMETYVSSAYAQYVGTFNFYQLEISSLEAQLTQNTTLHNEILDRLKNRNAANEHLNTMLEELMEDAGSAHLVKPFVNRLYVEMQKDELTLERQYLSFEEALAMQGVLRYEYVG